MVSAFHKRLLKSWLKGEHIGIYSTYNLFKIKSVVAE